MASLSVLERVAARLERDNLKLEAAAIRAVNAAYRTMSLADLLALVRQVSENPAPAYRVAQVDRLMAAFNEAARAVSTPPEELTPLLQNAVRSSITAAEQMIQTGGGLLEMFRVQPVREFEFMNHAADRLTHYWGAERQRFGQQVQSVLIEGLERGQGVNQIASSLRERVSVSRSRARLIAANELGNASAHAQRESQLEAGITHYIWRSAADARVRPEHRARNGQKFAWDDPPPDGHPGQPVRCRCVSLAVIPEEPLSRSDHTRSHTTLI